MAINESPTTVDRGCCLNKSFTPQLKKMLLAGCYFERQGKGDHEIWYLIAEQYLVVDSALKSRHMANVVLKQARLPKAFCD